MRRVLAVLILSAMAPAVVGCVSATPAAPSSPSRCEAFAQGVRELSLRIQTGMERGQYMERMGDLFVLVVGSDCPAGPEQDAFAKYLMADNLWRSCGMGVCDGEPMTNELLVTFWGDAARILRASPPP